MNIKKDKPSINRDDIDTPIELTDEEKREIELEARRMVNAERKKKLKQEYLRTLMRRLSGEVDVQHEKDEETYVEHIIDVAGHSDRIIMDGKHYMHNQMYKFNLHQLRTIKDIEAQTWRHEREVGNANRDFYYQPSMKNTVLTPRTMNSMGR